MPLLPRALVSRRGPPTTTRSSARASTASGLPRCVGRGSVFGVQFHPEKSSLNGLRMLESFVADLRAAWRARGHDPAPRHRHPRGQGRAAHPRRVRPEHRVRRRSARRRAALGGGGRARAAHRRPRRRAQRPPREPRSHPADRRLRSMCRFQVGGGLRTIEAVREAIEAGATLGGDRDRRVHATSTSSTRPSPSSAIAWSSRSTLAREARGRRLDRADRDPDRGGDRAARSPRRAAIRVLEHRPRWHARGPRPRRRPPRRRGGPRHLCVLGRRVLARGPARAGRAPPGQSARGDRRQGAVRAPLHGRRRRRPCSTVAKCTTSA